MILLFYLECSRTQFMFRLLSNGCQSHGAYGQRNTIDLLTTYMHNSIALLDANIFQIHSELCQITRNKTHIRIKNRFTKKRTKYIRIKMEIICAIVSVAIENACSKLESMHFNRCLNIWHQLCE